MIVSSRKFWRALSHNKLGLAGSKVIRRTKWEPISLTPGLNALRHIYSLLQVLLLIVEWALIGARGGGMRKGVHTRINTRLTLDSSRVRPGSTALRYWSRSRRVGKSAARSLSLTSYIPENSLDFHRSIQFSPYLASLRFNLLNPFTAKRPSQAGSASVSYVSIRNIIRVLPRGAVRGIVGVERRMGRRPGSGT